jgi:two-component system, NtrC family, sensor kinase
LKINLCRTGAGRKETNRFCSFFTSTLPDINGHPIIQQTVTLSRNGWQDVAKLKVHHDASMPEIPLYGGKIKQILLDMLANSSYALAQKFGAKPQEKGKIIISSKYLGTQIELTIADTGCGIAADHIDKIFDPFFTTKPVGQGRGQGLSVVHGIVVDNHGGSISVSSTRGAGAAFKILLPVGLGGRIIACFCQLLAR